MGHSAELFIDPNIDDEFICSICQDVLQDPMTIIPCEHVFCRTCIVEWNRNSLTCPIDRTTVDKLQPALRNFVNLLNKLQLRCKFSGCDATFPLGDVKSHDEKCDHNPSKGNKRALDIAPEVSPPKRISFSLLDHLEAFLSDDELEEDNWSTAQTPRYVSEDSNSGPEHQLDQDDVDIWSSEDEVELGWNGSPPPFLSPTPPRRNSSDNSLPNFSSDDDNNGDSEIEIESDANEEDEVLVLRDDHNDTRSGAESVNGANNNDNKAESDEEEAEPENQILSHNSLLDTHDIDLSFSSEFEEEDSNADQSSIFGQHGSNRGNDNEDDVDQNSEGSGYIPQNFFDSDSDDEDDDITNNRLRIRRLINGEDEDRENQEDSPEEEEFALGFSDSDAEDDDGDILNSNSLIFNPDPDASQIVSDFTIDIPLFSDSDESSND